MFNKIIIIFLLLCPTTIFSQKFDFSNISIGAAVEFQNTEGDLKEFWSAKAAYGLAGTYQLSETYFLEAALLYSSFKVKSVKDVPDFKLYKMYMGILKEMKINKIFSFNFSTGMENNTFSFNVDDESSSAENDMESEMGVYIKPGVVFKIKEIELNIYYRFQNIFTEPEIIKIHNLGVSLIL